MSLVPPCCGCLSCMTQLLWTCLRSAGLGLWRQSALSAWSPACCAQSASRQLALMFVCCRLWRHTAGCLAAQVCPARTARSGERQCQGYPDRRAGHLGPLPVRLLLGSSLPRAWWVCRVCTLSSVSSACRGSLFSQAQCTLLPGWCFGTAPWWTWQPGQQVASQVPLLCS